MTGLFSCLQAMVFPQKLTSYKKIDQITFKRLDIKRIKLSFLRFNLSYRYEIMRCLARFLTAKFDA